MAARAPDGPPRPSTTPRGRAAGGCTCSSPWPASARSPRRILMALPGAERLHDPGLLRHGHPGPGAARRGGHRHRAHAVAGRQPGARGSPGWRRCSPSPASLGTAALWATTSETIDVRLQRRVHGRQPGGGRRRARLRGGAARRSSVRLLELPPLPQWGRISYGVYLWYWPVLLVMTGQRLHWGVYPLFLARVGITVAIAALSYDLVEMPIRRGALQTLALLGGRADRRRGSPSAPCSSAPWCRWGPPSCRASQLAVSVPSSTTTPTTAGEHGGRPCRVRRPRADRHDDHDHHDAVVPDARAPGGHLAPSR